MKDTGHMNRDTLVRKALKVFSETRPEHFTDYRHCDECREHDDLLRKRNLESLSLNDVREEWNPLAAMTPEGFQYYVPAFIRLALSEPEGHFVFYLIEHYLSDACEAVVIAGSYPNKKVSAFTKDQVAVVLDFFRFVKQEYREQISKNGYEELMDGVLKSWIKFFESFE